MGFRGLFDFTGWGFGCSCVVSDCVGYVYCILILAFGWGFVRGDLFAVCWRVRRRSVNF